MEVKIAKVFPIFVVFQLSFTKTQAEGIPSNVDCLDILLNSNCQLNMTEESKRLINGNLSNPKTIFVRLNPIVRPYYSEEFWRVKNRSDEIGKYYWVWADGNIGRRFLALEYNFVEMSLWTLSPGVGKINIDLHEIQQGCWVTLNVTEQFCTLAALFLETIGKMAVTHHHLQDSVFCYKKNEIALTISYHCSDISNVSEFNFYLEGVDTRQWTFAFLKTTIQCIAVFFLPLFFVLFFPELLLVQYSQELQTNMKNFEVNSSKAQTPLSVFFSPGTRMSVLLVTFILIYPLVNIALFYKIAIDGIYYIDSVESYPFYLAYGLVPILLVCLSIFYVMQSEVDFETYKKFIDATSSGKFNNLRWILRLPRESRNTDCTVSTQLGDYISYEDILRTNLSSAINLLKDLKEDIGSNLKLRNAPLSLLRFIGGLFIIFLGTSPLFSMISTLRPTKMRPDLKTLAVTCFFFYFLICCMLSFAPWMLIVTMTITGVIINYDIVLSYVILVLSVFYYVYHPFYVLQENYLLLKDIVFKECSSLDPTYIKNVPVDSDRTDCSGSHAVPNNKVAPLECDLWTNGSSSTSTMNPNHVADDNARSPSPPNQDVEKNFQAGTDERINADENVEATGSRQSPSPAQNNEQTILLYISDDNGWERIPKTLWVSIYKKLLPLGEGIAVACFTSIAAVVMAIFLVLTVANFRDVSELQFSGQGIVSFITVSIPKLLLNFVNTEGNKQALKRSWEVTVRENVAKYIKENEIPDLRSAE